MKRIENPNTIFLYNGELVRVVAIADGKSILFESLEKEPCPHCLRPFRTELLERSPLFQDNAKPVETLRDPASGEGETDVPR